MFALMVYFVLYGMLLASPWLEIRRHSVGEVQSESGYFCLVSVLANWIGGCWYEARSLFINEW